MTHQQILAKRIELLEVKLLTSPMLSQSDCAVVMELAAIARQVIRAAKPEEIPRSLPFEHYQHPDL